MYKVDADIERVKARINDAFEKNFSTALEVVLRKFGKKPAKFGKHHSVNERLRQIKEIWQEYNEDLEEYEETITQLRRNGGYTDIEMDKMLDDQYQEHKANGGER